MRKVLKRGAAIVVVVGIMFSMSGCGLMNYFDNLNSGSHDIKNDREEEYSDKDKVVLSDEDSTHMESYVNKNDVSNADSQGGMIVYGIDGEPIDVKTSVIDAMETEDSLNLTDASELMDDALDSVDFEDDMGYCYSKLSGDERQLYKEIYAIVSQLQSDVVVSQMDDKVIDKVFRCVMNDNPGIFYVKGYSVKKYTKNDELYKVAISGTYTYSEEEVEIYRGLIEDYVTECLAGIDENADEYDKVKYVYDYIIDNTEYDISADDNQNVLGMCKTGKTVCTGYAKMTQLILDRLGVFVTFINGKACDSNGMNWESHVWNLVRVNGQYYNIDTTFGDAQYYVVRQDKTARLDEANYDYFLVPDEDIANTHISEPIVEMPTCSSRDDSFYVHEGLYFTDVDKEQLKAAFDLGYAYGKDILQIKCSDDEVYENMSDYLITYKHVLEYVPGNNASYVEYPKRRLLSIEL